MSLGHHRVRALDASELGNVLAVVASAEVADLGSARTTAEEIASQWAIPGFDLARDAWAVDGADGLAGVAWLLPGTGVLIAEVLPTACGCGIGTALRQAAERRAREVLPSGVTLKQHAIRGNAKASRLLAAAGYVPTHSYRRMRRDLREPLPAAATPAGLRWSTAAPFDHDMAIYDLAVRAYAQTPDFRRRAPELWCAKHLREPILYCAASPLLWDGEALAGCMLAEPPDAGGIPRMTVLAVDPDRRGAGLARALVLASLQAMAADGAAFGELDVLDGNPAIRLYESLGLRDVVVEDRFEKAP
jgi:GNAT superfamily N-acetyltransferase